MHELTAIIKAYRESIVANAQVVLATVVRTRGSVYRRAGARMLVSLDERGECTATGAISGGCLERDVCERALRVAATGEPVVITYDNTASEDIVWGLGLGCDGVVEVLLESLNNCGGENLMLFLAACLERRTRGTMATVIRADVEGTDEVAAHIGARSMLGEDGSIVGHPICRALVEDLHAAAQTTTVDTVNSVSHTKSYDTSRGEVEVFIESIEPPIPLVIFGAGADAVPVARLAQEVGLHVSIVDHRPAFATAERFPFADQIIICRPEAVPQEVTLDARTAAVVMTHSYEHDRELMKRLVASPARYIGMLGPKRRAERMLIELQAEESFEFDDNDLPRLHAPVGLDIGAETPEEIAVSIIAEVRACVAKRAGGSLKKRHAPIHDETGQRAADVQQARSLIPRMSLPVNVLLVAAASKVAG